MEYDFKQIMQFRLEKRLKELKGMSKHMEQIPERRRHTAHQKVLTRIKELKFLINEWDKRIKIPTEDSNKKTYQTLTKTITRLKLKCKKYNDAVVFRKEGLRQYSKLCDWLIAEKRMTKEEMQKFLKRKEEVKLP